MDAHLDVLLFEDVRGQLAEHVLRIPTPGYCVVDFRLQASSPSFIEQRQASRQACQADAQRRPRLRPGPRHGVARATLAHAWLKRQKAGAQLRQLISELQVVINYHCKRTDRMRRNQKELCSPKVKQMFWVTAPGQYILTSGITTFTIWVTHLHAPSVANARLNHCLEHRCNTIGTKMPR